MRKLVSYKNTREFVPQLTVGVISGTAHSVGRDMEYVHSGLTRRRFLGTGIAIATTMQLQRAASALGFVQGSDVCRLVAEQEVGPYYILDDLVRSDVSEGKAGIPLSLRIVVLDARTCQPLQNTAVDLWHCDSLGLYSGYAKQNPMGPGGGVPGFDSQHPNNQPGPPERIGLPPENHPTDKLTFLRGIQLTASDGTVVFKTIFPGFYEGRTNHIHFKVRDGIAGSGKSYPAGRTSHIGQIFFPEEVTSQLMRHEPYSLHTIHRTTQREDQVFGDQEGYLSIARLQPLYAGHFEAGFHAELVAAVDPTATPVAARRKGGPEVPPPPTK